MAEPDLVALIEMVVPSRGVEVRDGYVYVKDPELIAGEVLDGSASLEDVSAHVIRFERADADLLERFVNFEKDDDEKGDGSGLTRFVQRHGLLGLCKDGEPHHPGCEADRVEWVEGGDEGDGPPSLWEPPLSRGEVAIRESVEVWHRYRVRALSLLLIATHFQGKRPRGKPVKRGLVSAAWRNLIEEAGASARVVPGLAGGAHRYPTIERLMRNRALAIAMYSENLNDWLRAAPLSVSMVWDSDEERAQVRLTGTLLGILGYRILAATNQAMLLVFCDGCGAFFEPHPSVPETRRKYCALCRSKDVSGKDRQAQFRERKREIQRLGKLGISVDEIAALTSAKPEKIRKWIATARGQ